MSSRILPQKNQIGAEIDALTAATGARRPRELRIRINRRNSGTSQVRSIRNQAMVRLRTTRMNRSDRNAVAVRPKSVGATDAP